MLGMHAYSMPHPLTLVIAIVLYYSSAVVTYIPAQAAIAHLRPL